MILKEDKIYKIEKIHALNQDIHTNFTLIFDQYLGDKEDVKKALRLYEQTFIKQNKILELIKRQEYEKAHRILHSDIDTQDEALHEKLNFLIRFADTKANSFLQSSIEQEETTTLHVELLLFVLVLISVFLIVVILSSIVKPLNTFISMVEGIHKGDFTGLDKYKSSDFGTRSSELRKLFEAFHTILKQLIIPYANLVITDRTLIDISMEARRLLDAFDKNIVAFKTDTRGMIIYASKAFQNISGYTKEELVGQRVNIVNHEDMPKETFKELWQMIQNGKTWEGEIKNRTKDGNFFWVRSNISPDIDNNGKILGYNAISQDITVAKAYEELSSTLESRVAHEIQKNKEQTLHMLQQSRLAQMGEMLSMIAHQWRQPLSSISAISGTLTLDIEMENYNESFFKERLEAIGELSQHLSETINDFRGFFKESKKSEVFTLKKIIEESLLIIGSSLENKNIQLITNYEENLHVKSYANEVKQVILNLIKNAEDALVEKAVPQATIWINVYQNENYANISVEDNGEGVPPELFSKVFDPYFSTKKEKEGMGLGLYMSKIIIEDHCKGRLDLESTQAGSIFIIKLPLDEPNR